MAGGLRVPTTRSGAARRSFGRSAGAGVVSRLPALRGGPWGPNPDGARGARTGAARRSPSRPRGGPSRRGAPALGPPLREPLVRGPLGREPPAGPPERDAGLPEPPDGRPEPDDRAGGRPVDPPDFPVGRPVDPPDFPAGRGAPAPRARPAGGRALPPREGGRSSSRGFGGGVTGGSVPAHPRAPPTAQPWSGRDPRHTDGCPDATKRPGPSLSASSGGASCREIRRRPTLPGGHPPSTIGAGGLHFRVRNGNGCYPAAMATGNLCVFLSNAPPHQGWHASGRTPERARAYKQENKKNPKPSAD